MTENIQLILDIYMFGRKLKYTSKHENQDILLEFCILEEIKKADQKLANLAQSFFLNLPAMSEMINNLEKKNLITKILGEDKREKHIKLTESGKQYLEKSYKFVDQQCLSFVKVLTDDEIKMLDKMIHKLNNSL